MKTEETFWSLNNPYLVFKKDGETIALGVGHREKYEDRLKVVILRVVTLKDPSIDDLKEAIVECRDRLLTDHVMEMCFGARLDFSPVDL